MKNLILLAISSLIMIGCSEKPKELPHTQSGILKFTQEFEPSGIAYCNNTLYVVSDEGSFYVEKSGHGEYFTVKEEADYEGVTCHDGKIYLAEEGKDNIIEVDERGKILNKFNINRKFDGKKVISKKGDGLEGITFYSEDDNYIYFIVSNQSDKFEGKDKSSIFYVKVDRKTNEGDIVKYFPMKINDISGLLFEDHLVHFLSDDRDMLYIANEEMEILKSYKLPGDAQEGIAIDVENKTMYIADDEGFVLRLELDEYPLFVK